MFPAHGCSWRDPPCSWNRGHRIHRTDGCHRRRWWSLWADPQKSEMSLRTHWSHLNHWNQTIHSIPEILQSRLIRMNHLIHWSQSIRNYREAEG